MCPRYGPPLMLLCGAVFGALVACAATRSSPRGSPPAVEFRDLEHQVARLVNAHRAERRLRALRYDTLVAAIARAHSREMAAGGVPLGHQGFDQRAAAVERVDTFNEIAENVALNDYRRERTVAVAMRGWLASEHHLANIEGPYNITGVGVARARDGTFFYTEIFVARR
jgi:uncharacterized protein YkwD